MRVRVLARVRVRVQCSSESASKSPSTSKSPSKSPSMSASKSLSRNKLPSFGLGLGNCSSSGGTLFPRVAGSDCDSEGLILTFENPPYHGGAL